MLLRIGYRNKRSRIDFLPQNCSMQNESTGYVDGNRLTTLAILQYGNALPSVKIDVGYPLSKIINGHLRWHLAATFNSTCFFNYHMQFGMHTLKRGTSTPRALLVQSRSSMINTLDSLQIQIELPIFCVNFNSESFFGSYHTRK